MSMEHGAAGSLHAGVGAAGTAVPGVAVPGMWVSGAGGSWGGPAASAAGKWVAAGCHRVCCMARQDIVNSSGGEW